MSSSDSLKYQRMQERLEALQEERTISKKEVGYLIPNMTSGNYFTPVDMTTNLIPTGTANQSIYPMPPMRDGTVRMYLAPSEHETIRQIVREEMRSMPWEQAPALDYLMEAIQGEPDHIEEMASILAKMTEDEFEKLVQRVKEMKRV